MKKYFAVILAGLLVIGFSSVSQAVSTIDTTGSWNGSSYVHAFGETNTSTYGQTFTVTGSETTLDSFTFYMNDNLNSDYVDFEAYVYAWDGNKATGSVLYQSSPMSSTNNGGSDGYEAFTMETGGVSLTSGVQYVAFFSAANQFDGETGTSKWGALGGADVYDGGQFVFMNNGSDFDQLFSYTWTKDWLGYGSDLAFSMEFSETAPIPEPGTMLLLGSGLAGLVGYRKKFSV